LTRSMKAEIKDKLQEAGGEARIIYRTDFLLAAGALALISGLLLPVHARILDVLLIFIISLTAAVLIITFFAQGAVQVQSYPLLIVVVTSLRMALGAAGAKLILVQGKTGTLIPFFGELVVGKDIMLGVLLFSLLATITFSVALRGARRISRTAGEFASAVLPTRDRSIETALAANIISESDARSLEAKTGLETRFFVGMNGAANFILYCAVVEFVIIIVSIMASMAIGAAAATPGGTSLRTHGILAVGAGTITVISLFTISAASSHLVKRSFTSSGVADWFAECSCAERAKILAAGPKVIANEVGTCGQRQWAETDVQAALSNKESCREAVATDTEWLREREAGSGDAESEDGSFWSWQEIKNHNGYELIAELIENKGVEGAKTVLLAAERVDELPVTVPVNASMRMAQRDQRCLLVDLDWERDAVARVFEDRAQDYGDQEGVRKLKAPETPTCINNLWICAARSLFERGPGHGDGGHGPAKLNDRLAELKGRYDRVIVYAPNIGSVAEWQDTAEGIDLAMLFGSRESDVSNSSIGRLYRLLIESQCEVLRPSEVLTSVV